MKAHTLTQFSHRSARRLSIAIAFAVTAFGSTAQAVSLDPTVNEHIVMLPVISNGSKLQFETTIFRPPGEGPFPLLVMNHGIDRGNPA